jgi:hypothetical protein
VSRRDWERFADILAATEAIRSHLRRGDCLDTAIHTPVRRATDALL